MKLDRRNSSAGKLRRLQRRRAAMRMGWPLALAVGFSVPGFAQTLPQGGNVVGGSGTITQTAPNQLTINQATQNLAIDWQSFSIGPNNIVRFVQPSTSAVALNRVLNGDPSQIYGQIQANGQVVIMSPNGIVFGPSSRIDVNALVATTANISTLDFMAGKLLFDQASSDANARVVNQGIISVAQGGFAVLAAANVSNQGQIIANGGTVVLGGTKTFAIDFHGDGLLKFAATGVVDQKPVGADALVENSGSIEANGGRVLLTARAARSVLDNVINTTGIVVAKTASLVNGEIVIDGGDSGIVRVAGTLDASGAAAGEAGGTVKVLGEKVGLFENARIDASGNAGGGTVLVGGNYQGKGPEANAQYLYMDARAVIDASSASGDGGRVILWSDLATRNAGHINVSGARNGGFVEVSSKGFLDFRGTVNLRGLAGRGGELLLDPTDITITNAASSGDMSGTSPFAGSNASSNLDVAVLNSALNSGSAVTVTVTTASAGAGTGNIDVTASIVNGYSGNTLVLRADGAITVGTGGYISSGGYLLNVSLRAAGNITVGGTGIATSGGNITTESAGGGGQAGGNFVSTASINAGSGNVTLAHVGSIAIGGTLNTSGLVSVNAGGATTQTAAITGSGALAVGGTGAVTLANASNAFGSITLARAGTTSNVALLTSITPNVQTSTLGQGTFSLTSTAGFTQSGAITQDAGGGTVAIVGGAGTVTLSQANTWTGALSVTGGTISVTAAQTATGAGSLSLDATTNVVVNANLATAGGNISIWGNAPGGTPSGSPSVGVNVGVNLQRTSAPSVAVNAGGGNISIAGAGGDGGTYSHGVLIDGVVVQTSGTGAITVVGKGGASAAGAEQAGVYINGDTALSSAFSPGTALTSGSGGISITGNGGATGSGGANFGVRIARATLTATGGSITAVGVGGAGAGSDSIEVAGGSLLATGSGGQISLQGQTPVGTGTGISLRNSYDGASTAVAIGGGSFLGNVVLQADTLTNTATTLTISRQTLGGSATFAPYSTATNVTFNNSGAGLALTSGILSSVSNFATLVAGSTTGTGTLTVGSAYTAPTGVSLTLNSGGAMTVGNALTTAGTGTLTLNSARNVVVGANLTTAGGDMLITGNVASWAPAYETNAPVYGTTSGNFDGVVVNAGVSINANGGDIAIAGKGGNTGANQHGVRIYAAAATPTTISTIGAGTITLFGQGGLSSDNNFTVSATPGLGGSHGGFRFDGDATGVVDVSTVNGNIKMVGAGGGTGVTSDNNGGGIFFYTKVRTTGTGAIDIAGTPGVGASVGLAALFTQTEISTVSGNIALTGTGGTAYVDDAAFAGSAKGLWLSGATVKTTGTGNITLRGIEGTQGPGILISDVTYGTVTLGAATMTGDLTIRTDSLTYTGTNTIAHQVGSGTVTFRTNTDATTIGAAGGGGVLQVTSTILNAVTGFATQIVGSATQTGQINIGGTTGLTGSALGRNTSILAGSATIALASDGNPLALGGYTLTVSSDNIVGQSGGITGAGTLALAGAANVTLTSVSNAFTGLQLARTGAGTTTISTTAGLTASGTWGTGTFSATADSVTLGGALSSTGGALDLTAARFVTIGNNIDTGGGNIAISANAGGAGGGGDFAGVFVNAATVQSRGGNINIIGRGSASGTTVSGQHGIFLNNGGIVRSYTSGGDGTSGTVTLSGTGGSFAGTGNGGVVLIGGTSLVSSLDGNITITATGGTGGAGNSGLYLGGGTIRTAGTGAIGVTATAANGDSSRGIAVTGSGTGASGAIETTGTGNINLTGTGGATGIANSGVFLYATGADYGVIRATGAGNVTVTGTGGAANQINQFGVIVEAAGSIISTTSGALAVTGTAGGGAAAGILIQAGGALATTGGNLVATGTAATGAGVSLDAATVSTAGAGTLTLDSTSGAVGLTGLNNASIATGTGTLTLVSDRDLLLDSAVLTTGGAVAVTANGIVDLANVSNSIGGTTTVTGTGSLTALYFRNTSANRDLTVAAAGALDLADLEVTGNLTASAAGMLSVTDSFAMAAGKNVSLTATGAASAIEISSAVTLSNGNFTATSERGIVVTANIATNGGNLLMLGGGATWASPPTGTPSFAATPTGNFAGVLFGAGGSVAAGGGYVAIAGEGGNDSAGSQHGVHMTNAAQISTTGTVSIYGQGGNSIGVGNLGVYLQGGSTIETVNSTLTVVGTGGGAGGSFHNIGISVEGGIVRTTGSGALDATGVGGLIGNGVIVTVAGGAIRTVDGNLTVTGTGTDIRTGIEMTNYAGMGIVESTGTGNVNFIGTGGAGTGTGAHGISLDGAGQVRSNSGSLTLNGTGGSTATASHGIYLANGMTVASTSGATNLLGAATNGSGLAASATGWTIGSASSTGDVTLTTDTASLSSTGALIQTAGDVHIAPSTGGTTISVGGVGGTLQLPANMGFVDAATLIVGSASSGNLTVAAGGLATANATSLVLQGANIALNGNVTMASGPSGDLLTLSVGAAGTVTQGAGSNITAGSLVLRGAGDFTLTRDGNLYNTIDHLAVAPGVANVSLRADAAGGTLSAEAETDHFGSLSGISATSLILSTSGGIGQASGALVTVTGGGGASFNAGAGGVVLNETGNVFGGTITVATAGVADLRNSGNTVLGNIAALDGLIVVSGGSLTQSTGAALTGGGSGTFSAVGTIALTETGNDLGTVSLATTMGGAASYTDSNAFALGNSNVSAGLTLVSGGTFTQSGTVTTGAKYDLTAAGNVVLNTASVGGPLIVDATGTLSQAGALAVTGNTIVVGDNGIALTNAGNVLVGSIAASTTTGGISLANTGNTVLGSISSNGVLNVSVTGGTLTQTSATAVTTTGNATLTLAGAFAMTLTEAGNNVGGNLALSGSTGTLNGTLGGSVAVTTGTFLINGTTYTGAPPTNTTTPAPGAGAGGTTISSALTDAAPVSQIQAAANLPPPPPPAAAAAGSSALALLTGGPAPLVGGGPAGPAGPAGPGGQAEGGEGGPAVSPVGVVSAPPPPPAAAAPGAPPPAASPGAPPPPAIVVSGGPPPGPGAAPLVPVTAPPPAVTAVGNVGGASAPAVNGGALPPQSSTPRTAVTAPFPSMSF
jgi:filamentous hemagglutinin family protein